MNPNDTSGPSESTLEVRHECHRLIALGKGGALELVCGKCSRKIPLTPPLLRAIADMVESGQPLKMTLISELLKVEN